MEACYHAHGMEELTSSECPHKQSIGSLSHSNQGGKRSKRHPNCRGIKTITVSKWHDSVYTKPYRLHQKTTRPNK